VEVETGGMVAVVAAVKAKRPEPVMTAVSASRRSVFIMGKNVRWNGKLHTDLRG
jgi:hypothetical protein